MKHYIFYIMLVLLNTAVLKLNAQTINWGNLSAQQKHVVNLHTGVEYGMQYGIGYSYQINNKLFPVFLNVDFSAPAGEKLLDDFKTKLGANIRWVRLDKFQFSTRLHGVFRSYQNDFAQLLNFGSDFSGIAGYYRTRWFAAGEVGFDKAIVTHFTHSDAYKAQYPDVGDGWFEPSTGGNFYYGLQAGFSPGKHDITVRAGKMITQDFKHPPLIPFYAELGYNIRF